MFTIFGILKKTDEIDEKDKLFESAIQRGILEADSGKVYTSTQAKIKLGLKKEIIKK